MTRGLSDRHVRKQAAAWFARLADSHSAEDRERFEVWLAGDPARRIAYDRMAASYEASGVLRTSDVGRRRSLGGFSPRRNLSLTRALAGASLALLLVAGAYRFDHGFGDVHKMALESVMLSSGAAGRNVTLADGSRLIMAPLSQVRIELTRSERIAELRKGRLRLAVARENRPFKIVAGSSATVTRKGVYDAHIVEGQGVIATAHRKTDSQPDAPSIEGALDFNAEPLGQAVDQINRMRDGPPIELGPGLAALRVTGTFQGVDSTVIARALAAAFDLHLSRTGSGAILLER